MCLATTAMATLAVVAPPSPASAQTSPLSKTGTVVGTGSTTTAAPGSTIDWVVSSTNPTDGPVNATITDPIQAAGTDQAYVPGSLQVPPGFSPEWSTDGGSSFSATDQGTATNVVRASNPDLQSPATASGAVLPPPFQAVASPTNGDGFHPILFTTDAGVQQIWNIFHHTAANQMVCTDRLTGTRCAGWTGSRALTTTPGPFGSGPSDVYSMTSTSVVVDPSDPHVYWALVVTPVDHPASAGMLCMNLQTQSTCGYTPLSTSSLALNTDNGQPVLVGTKSYALAGKAGQMLCFDTATIAACPGQPYPMDQLYGLSITPAINGQIFGAQTQQGVGTQMRAWCFDPATNAKCAGWNPSKVTNAPFGTFGGNGPRFATYDASGTVTGVCVGSSYSLTNFVLACYDLAGNPVAGPPGIQFTNPAAYSVGQYETYGALAVAAPNGHTVTYFPVIQSRTGFGSARNGGTYCYDWTAASPCASWPTTAGVPGDARWTNVNGGKTEDYGYAFDGQCVFGLGNAGWLFSFDPVTGASPCSKTTATMTLDPSAFYCDGKPGHVQGYDSVSLEDIDLSTVNFTTSSVTIRDGDGNVVGTFAFDPVTGEADISSIPATTSPIEATLDIVLLNGSSFTATNHPRAVLSFVGDAPQMCFQTRVAADCTATEVSNQATATYVPSGGGAAIDATSPLVTLAVTGASSTATSTHGSSYGVDVAALGVHL
ncbi:MAG: hypothetical protein QOE93_632, partial [Actinomycetota bacterium]|nr:hypothetical protein [Actinomycetota bacterium]